MDRAERLADMLERVRPWKPETVAEVVIDLTDAVLRVESERDAARADVARLWEALQRCQWQADAGQDCESADVFRHVLERIASGARVALVAAREAPRG